MSKAPPAKVKAPAARSKAPAAQSNNRKPVRRFVLHKIAPPIAIWTYKRLGQSWRYVTENEAELNAFLNNERPPVGAFLHARTFQLLHYFSRPQAGRWILMCSQSRDGELMTRVEEGLGFRVARGSSGKGGARALVEMIKAQREDRRLGSCLAIDGSRGPRGIAQPGILTLAQKSAGILMPVAASTKDCWVWQKSWDRTVIPKPGAEVHVRVGKPIEVPAQMDTAGAEALRLTLEKTLLDLHAELDERIGFRDTQPLQAPRPAPTTVALAVKTTA